MPVEGFEPSTLAGLVFETSAYTVPPRRLGFWLCKLIEHGFLFSVRAEKKTDTNAVKMR